MTHEKHVIPKSNNLIVIITTPKFKFAFQQKKINESLPGFIDKPVSFRQVRNFASFIQKSSCMLSATDSLDDTIVRKRTEGLFLSQCKILVAALGITALQHHVSSPLNSLLAKPWEDMQLNCLILFRQFKNELANVLILNLGFLDGFFI